MAFQEVDRNDPVTSRIYYEEVRRETVVTDFTYDSSIADQVREEERRFLQNQHDEFMEPIKLNLRKKRREERKRRETNEFTDMLQKLIIPLVAAQLGKMFIKFVFKKITKLEIPTIDFPVD